MNRTIARIGGVGALLLAVALMRVVWVWYAIPSLTTVVLLWLILLGRHLFTPPSPEDLSTLLVSASVLGILLYLSSFAVIRADVYAAGFASIAPLLLAIVAAIAARRAPWTAAIVLLDLVALDVHLLPSANLFDYLLDPLLVAGATIWFVRSIVKSSRRPAPVRGVDR